MDLSRLSHIPPSDQLAAQVRSETDTLLLAFSGGKDSLATWLFLREQGFVVHPYYMYLVPGLRSDREMLDHYEQAMSQRVLRVPHPVLYYNNLLEYVYQPPQNVAKIRSLGMHAMTISDYPRILAGEYGLDAYYNAMGFRASDSLYRRGFISFAGALSQGRGRHYYPIWDWSLEQTLDRIQASGVKLWKIYRTIRRNILSLEYRDLVANYADYPDDIERIKVFFPLVGAEFFRNEVLAVRYGKA
jgi:hypothetical protein